MTSMILTSALKKKPVVKKAAVDPWTSMLGGLMAPGPSPTSSVDASIKAGVAANNAAIAAQRAEYENQAKRAQGFALALRDLTANDPASIANQYRESAKTLQGFGTGLTGAVQEAQQSNADRIAAEVARVTGGLGQAASYDIPGLRNTAQMSGVVIPASSLAGEAAQAYAGAAANRAASVGSIGSIAQEYLRKVGELQSGVLAQNEALQAKRPELLLEAQKQAQDNLRQNIATYIQARYLGNTIFKTKADIQQAKADAKAAAAKAKTEAAPVFNATNSRAKGYEVDQYGNPLGGKIVPLPGYQVNALGTGVVKDPKAKKSKFTAAQQVKYMADAAVMADLAWKGAAAVTDSKTGDIKQPAVPKMTWQRALNEMTKAGVPREFAIAALTRVGYTPGVRGRPYTQAQIDAMHRAIQGAGVIGGDVFGGVSSLIGGR